MKTFRPLSICASLLLFVLCSTVASAAERELAYSRTWCEENNGEPEYRLPDGTRCDCLTETHAVEVELAHKWSQAIGQALHYAFMSNRRAAIVLILRSDNDRRYIRKLQMVVSFYDLPIDVEYRNEETLKGKVENGADSAIR